MLTKDNIIARLFEKFSFFREQMAYEPDELLPYNIIGDFALDFQKKFINFQLAPREIDNFFDFANKMAESNDREVQNIFVVEVLEIFSDNEKTINIAKEKLNDKGKKLLEKILKGWKDEK